MNQPPIRISIAPPCHERWDRMTATDRGAFCQVCSQEVVDFTAMTDAEVISFLEKNSVGCGKFRNEQLYQPPLIQERSRLLSLWKTALTILLPFLGFKEAYAQSGHRVQRPAMSTHKADTSLPPIVLDEVTVRAPMMKKCGTETVGNMAVIRTQDAEASPRLNLLPLQPQTDGTSKDSTAAKKQEPFYFTLGRVSTGKYPQGKPTIVKIEIDTTSK